MVRIIDGSKEEKGQYHSQRAHTDAPNKPADDQHGIVLGGGLQNSSNVKDNHNHRQRPFSRYAVCQI